MIRWGSTGKSLLGFLQTTQDWKKEQWAAKRKWSRRFILEASPVGTADTWRSWDLTSAECASHPIRKFYNSCLQSVTVITKKNCSLLQSSFVYNALCRCHFVLERLLIFTFWCCLADINECMTGSHNCNSNASCSNTNGSFLCSCNDGFSGNGTSCDGTCRRKWSKSLGNLKKRPRVCWIMFSG